MGAWSLPRQITAPMKQAFCLNFSLSFFNCLASSRERSEGLKCRAFQGSGFRFQGSVISGLVFWGSDSGISFSHPRSGVVRFLKSMLSLPSARSQTAVLNGNVSLKCPIAESPCSAQPQRIPAVPNRRVPLQCSMPA